MTTPQARRARAAQQEAERVVLAFDAWERGSAEPPRTDERLLFRERHLARMVRDVLLAFAAQEAALAAKDHAALLAERYQEGREDGITFAREQVETAQGELMKALAALAGKKAENETLTECLKDEREELRHAVDVETDLRACLAAAEGDLIRKTDECERAWAANTKTGKLAKAAEALTRFAAAERERDLFRDQRNANAALAEQWLHECDALKAERDRLVSDIAHLASYDSAFAQMRVRAEKAEVTLTQAAQHVRALEGMEAKWCAWWRNDGRTHGSNPHFERNGDNLLAESTALTPPPAEEG